MDAKKFTTSLLQKHKIPFEAFEHEAVFTVDQSNELNLEIPGFHTKNLFLQDKFGRCHLVCIG